MDKNIIIDIGPLTQIRCRAKDCAFNLIWKGSASCNLKNISIGSSGECISKELRKENFATIDKEAGAANG